LEEGRAARNPQGLAWDGTYLWFLDANFQHSKEPYIYKIDFDESSGAGEIISSFVVPGLKYNQKGLAWDGTYLLSAAAESGGRIYVIDPSEPGNATYLSVGPDYPYGLAFEESPFGVSSIWTVDNKEKRVYELSRNTGSTVSSFPIDVGADREPAGLSFDGTYLWLSAFGKNDKLYGYTKAGSLVGTFTAEPFPTGGRAHPIGATWDGDYLWYVDGCTDYFYRIQILFQ